MKSGHAPRYACNFPGCEITYYLISELEAHTEATHENGGKCTVCEYQYETHTETKTSIPYEDTSHIERTTCSACSYVVLRRNRSLFRRRKPCEWRSMFNMRSNIYKSYCDCI